MSFWNPQNKRYIYFHCTYGPDNNRKNDYYLKIDTIEKKVWKVQHTTMRVHGKYYHAGIVELKWISFISKHGWNLKNFQYIKQCEARDQKQRWRIRYTTENQFINAVVEALEQMTGIKELIKFTL